MASVNTTTELNGFIKSVYADKIAELVPTNHIVQKLIPFAEAEGQLGGTFNFGVALQHEHGFVYGAADATLALPTPITGVMKNASVGGFQIGGSTRISYDLMYKAMKEGNNKQAFGSSLGQVVENLINSASKRLEIELLWGRSGIGTVASQSGSGATRTFVITTAEWSAGIWAGMVGAKLDIYISGGAIRNATTDIAVTSVNHASKSIVVSGLAAELDAVANTDVIFFKSGSTTNSMISLHGIIANTATSMFGIDPSTYPLWAGNTYSSATTPTMAKVLSADSLCVAFGRNKDAVALVSPESFATLAAEQMALRSYDHSYSPAKAVSGVAALEFQGQAGKLKVVAHPYQKLGYIHVFVPEQFRRIGATDLTMRRQGKSELVLETASETSAEMRVYANQAIISMAPRHNVVLTGVTP